MAAQNDSEAGLQQFKTKLNALIKKVVSGEGDFSFPKGEFEGVATLELEPGKYDYIFTYTPEGSSDDRMVEVHLYPNKNPRQLYDEVKEAALKPDSWGQIAGWVDSPSGYPNRNQYDDIRMCGMEGNSSRYLRWVQQTEGAAGGYFVRLETTSEAPKDYLKEYADALWYIVNEAGYYNPSQ
jgi:hypothetical protein